jgi:hypothetical protein
VITEWIWSTACRAAVLCCGLALSARAASAQHMRRLEVFVIDSMSGAPIELADVQIVPKSHGGVRPPSRVMTDSVGRFLFSAASNEQLLISVRRLGFVPAEVASPPSENDDVMVIAMVPSPPVLAPTVTTAEPTTHRLEVTGFYERRHIGPGTFLDSAAISKQKPWDLLSLLRPYLRGCTMIFVDGMRLVALRDVKIEDVLGIEIYRSNEQAPPQFANPIESLNRCGSIVVWRRF